MRDAETVNELQTMTRGRLKSLLSAAAITVGIAITLVFWVWIDSGRSPAERAATAMAMPLGVLWLGCLFASLLNCLNSRRLTA